MGNTNAALPQGTILDGKYRIGDLLGKGGMGEVYGATHVDIGHRVAIKILHREHVRKPETVSRFHREARLAGSLGHDHICEVTDIGTTADGSPYLIMPMLEGRSFGELLREEGLLPLHRVVDIICQTLGALAEAHARHIVHRDLKPDNIFLTRFDDRNDFVKLLDFGIAKVQDLDAEATDLTQTGTVIGTPVYMSPEQAQGIKELDCKTDIYSVGVILYEALTGRRPYEADSYTEFVFKIASESFPSPRKINPSIPPLIEEVVLKAISRTPIERFENATEMHKALRSAVQSVPETFDSQVTGRDTAVSFGEPRTGLNRWTRASWTENTAANQLGDRRRILWIRPVVLVTLALALAVFFGLSNSGNGRETVSITLKGVPKGAAIFFDHSKTAQNPLRVEKGDKPRPLRIDAHGFAPFSVSIVPSEDRIVEVMLQAVSYHPCPSRAMGYGVSRSLAFIPEQKGDSNFASETAESSAASQ